MKKILGRLIIVAPAVIIQILWMNFLYNKLNNSALVTLLLTILAFFFESSASSTSYNSNISCVSG